MLSSPTQCHEASEILMLCFVPCVGYRSLIRAACGARAMPDKMRGLSINSPCTGQQKTYQNKRGDPKRFGR